MRLLMAVLFVFGLILAGSDGPWFPWVNGIGVLMFFCMVVISWKRKSSNYV